MKINKLNAGLLVVSMLGTISVFAMDSMQATGTMMNSDKMVSATPTMMHVDNMMATSSTMITDDMMMKITNKSPRGDVAKLQQFLIDKGFLKLIKGTKLGFFGPATKGAWKKYESSKMMMNHGNKMMSTTTMMQSTTTMMHQ